MASEQEHNHHSEQEHDHPSDQEHHHPLEQEHHHSSEQAQNNPFEQEQDDPSDDAYTMEATILPPANMDADDYEHDSTFGGDRESLASSSTSLNSEITRYQFEHGRRYHGYRAGAYLFPNDEEELNRMDIEHQNCLVQFDGKLHLCPLDNPKEILDLGTGTGLWAIDMADQYPECNVIGTDLSPVQPSWVPRNCEFLVDDFEQDWTFGEDRFDLIHARYLCGAVASYPDFYKRIYKALKPGGWVELVDIQCGTFCDDGTVPPDSPSNIWWSTLGEAFEKLGKPILPIEAFPKYLEEVGFENINLQMLKRPTNDWPKDPKMKEVGRYTCLNFLEGLAAFSNVPFTRALGWTIEEVTILNAQVKKETVTRKMHGWQKAMCCYAQKPLFPADPK